MVVLVVRAMVQYGYYTMAGRAGTVLKTRTGYTKQHAEEANYSYNNHIIYNIYRQHYITISILQENAE